MNIIFDIRGGIDYGCSDNKTVIDLIYDMYSYLFISKYC